MYGKDINTHIKEGQMSLYPNSNNIYIYCMYQPEEQYKKKTNVTHHLPSSHPTTRHCQCINTSRTCTK